MLLLELHFKVSDEKEKKRKREIEGDSHIGRNDAVLEFVHNCTSLAHPDMKKFVSLQQHFKVLCDFFLNRVLW